jgi:hypothetical protein
MKITKAFCAAYVASALLAVSVYAQQTVPKSITVSNNKTESNLPLKDESGRVLTRQEAFALTHTGNYRMMRMVDRDNKPYVLVKKMPGTAPRPESAPVVVKP